ncbi:60S ribosomal protein L37 [Moesziomyces antarcticus]|uniref:60S ribosomal protein L37 n=1 Tax=Pseudozyma antarctica TaxID=84753 RepID=A0A081CD34_PSEA2|nr:60S ribosomal protein L37 [Moesziomyces antarcticus]GAK64580.1 60S ribosomal protein L37 [Moesziomyces antarcticus]
MHYGPPTTLHAIPRASVLLRVDTLRPDRFEARQSQFQLGIHRYSVGLAERDNTMLSRHPSTSPDSSSNPSADSPFVPSLLHRGWQQSKRTVKVGITGKYGTRYGASLRRQIKKIEISQHSKYTCTFCGKDSVKRKAVGIWECRACKKVMAGGAWTLSTSAAATVRSTIRRLRELTEA